MPSANLRTARAHRWDATWRARYLLEAGTGRRRRHGAASEL